MAKSKNATTHHLGQKIHKNGIYKLKEHRHKSTKGVNYHPFNLFLNHSAI